MKNKFLNGVFLLSGPQGLFLKSASQSPNAQRLAHPTIPPKNFVKKKIISTFAAPNAGSIQLG